jgi:hypothetical protein
VITISFTATEDFIDLLNGTKATGTITCNGVQAADTVTVNGLVYTGVSGTKSDNTEFSVDTGNTACALDLANSIRDDLRAPVTVPAVDVTAESSAAVVTVTAKVGGTDGNSITLASSNGARLVLSGANLTGGADNGFLYGNVLSLTAKPSIRASTDDDPLSFPTNGEIIVQNERLLNMDTFFSHRDEFYQLRVTITHESVETTIRKKIIEEIDRVMKVHNGLNSRSYRYSIGYDYDTNFVAGSTEMIVEMIKQFQGATA